MSSILLAIVLVVNSTRGHYYLFSYPPDPKRNLIHNNNNNNNNSSNSSSNHNSSNSHDFTVGSAITTRMDEKRDIEPAEEEDKDIFAGRDTIFNIDVSFLADALAPESSLCDRKFQLTIDDLTFVGHPVSISSVHKQHQEVESDLNSPSSPISQNTQSPQSDNDGTSSHLSNSTDNERTNSEENKSKVKSTDTQMTLFHVVFVMSPPDLELNAQVETLYKHVILRYSSALRYEQLRCGYVQEEMEKVLGLKDEVSKSTPYNQVMQKILSESSLARDIKQIYTSISANKAAHVIVNDFIDLSLQIPSIGSASSSSMLDRENFVSHQSSVRTKDNHSSLMDVYSVGGYEYDSYPVICPYHTLLLLEDPEEVLKNMPLDASPTLVHLVQILTPTQSLQELHLLLDCSLAQIYRLAAHLIYWRKAKLIHTISTRNTYVVSPHANLDDLASLEADFKSHIPNLSLAVLLSKLSHGQPYYQVYHLKEHKNQYLEAITFLIRKDLVVQLHTYLVLLPERKQGNETPQSEMEETSGSPNNMEWRMKRSTYERAPKEIADLFERLRPYMNGQHHSEEIFYREGISRKQLSLVLKYYPDKIATVQHY